MWLCLRDPSPRPGRRRLPQLRPLSHGRRLVRPADRRGSGRSAFRLAAAGHGKEGGRGAERCLSWTGCGRRSGWRRGTEPWAFQAGADHQTRYSSFPRLEGTSARGLSSSPREKRNSTWSLPNGHSRRLAFPTRGRTLANPHARQVSCTPSKPWRCAGGSSKGRSPLRFLPPKPAPEDLALALRRGWAPPLGGARCGAGDCRRGAPAGFRREVLRFKGTLQSLQSQTDQGHCLRPNPIASRPPLPHPWASRVWEHPSSEHLRPCGRFCQEGKVQAGLPLRRPRLKRWG